MNMVLIMPSDLAADSAEAVLRDRRHEHVRKILRADEGDSIRIGLLNGPRGRGLITAVNDNETRLRLELEEACPPRPRVSVVLAMVRPRIVRQTLTALASLGCRRIMLINARNVEKPYFSQRLFDDDAYKEFLYLGLEQAVDTWLPELTIHTRFRRFIEDELPGLVDADSYRYVAHPADDTDVVNPPEPDGREVVLAIGPEGGWVDFEVDAFRTAEFRPVSFGPRILRVETALPYFFGHLNLLAHQAPGER